VKRVASTRACVGLSVAAVLLATVLVLPATASAQSDVTPPETTITQKPPNPTSKRDATFAFTGTDNLTPAADIEFQCRLDPQNAAPGTDPLSLWLDCLSPQVYTGLAPGKHTFEVQALDAEENVDPTPATYTWTVGDGAGGAGGPSSCADASGTIAADADTYIEEKAPLDNKGADGELKLMSKAPNENSRALVRFPIPQAPAGCVLQSATLKLYSDSAPDVPTNVQALRLTGAWGENTAGWGNQPQSAGPAVEAALAMGYVQWNVTALVQAGAGNGFLIRHVRENDPNGAEAAFFSKEKLESPPQLDLTYSGEASGGGGGSGGANPPPGQPGSPDTPARPPSSRLGPTVAQIAATLRADLRTAARTLRRAGIAKLVRKRGVNVKPVRAVIPGTLRVVTVVGGKRVVVLRGTRKFARAGKATLRLKLTKRGRQVLKRKRSAKLTLRGSFADRTAVIRAPSVKVTVKRRGLR
jgi:hypothetical protein